MHLVWTWHLAENKDGRRGWYPGCPRACRPREAAGCPDLRPVVLSGWSVLHIRDAPFLGDALSGLQNVYEENVVKNPGVQLLRTQVRGAAGPWREEERGE